MSTPPALQKEFYALLPPERYVKHRFTPTEVAGLMHTAQIALGVGDEDALHEKAQQNHKTLHPHDPLPPQLNLLTPDEEKLVELLYDYAIFSCAENGAHIALQWKDPKILLDIRKVAAAFDATVAEYLPVREQQNWQAFVKKEEAPHMGEASMAK